MASDEFPVAEIQASVSGMSTTVQLSGTSSEAVYPAAMGVKPSMSVDLAKVGDVCRGFLPVSADVTWTLDTSGGTTSADNVIPHLGLAKAKDASGNYTSPFLRALTARKFTGWTVTEHLKQIAIHPGILSSPCIVWQWTPLVTLPGYEGLYAIKLDPTPANTWTHAVIDVGFWLSNLPGSSPCTRAVSLRTQTGQSILLTPSTYVDYVDTRGPKVPLGPDVCVLGVSCLAWDSACAFDLANSRFGLSTLFISNIG